MLPPCADLDWLAEGRQESRQDEAASMTLRLLNRRCGPLSEATTAQIQALPLEQLEALAVGAAFSAGVALLYFQGPAFPTPTPHLVCQTAKFLSALDELPPEPPSARPTRLSMC